jgi:phospholipase C
MAIYLSLLIFGILFCLYHYFDNFEASSNIDGRILKINSFFEKEKNEYLEEKNRPEVLESSIQVQEEEKPIVHLKVTKRNAIIDEKYIGISWETSPTNMASNSWIGLYPYGQKNSNWNLLSSFLVNKTLVGHKEILLPKEAGVYEVRYIQDNNLFTIATSGPIVLNPSDSYLLTNKNKFQLGEKVTIKWKFSGSTLNKFRQGKQSMAPLETKICLSILGINNYDDCNWSEQIQHEEGQESFYMPKFAGFFIVRILLKYNTWKFEPEVECLLSSDVLHLTSASIILVPKKYKATVASTMEVNWEVDRYNQQDWIGIYSISNSEIFSRSAKPIASTKITSFKGNFHSYIPPNHQAGGYIFIYFSDHQPIAVSEVVLLQQPSLTCPQRDTMSNIKHLVIICTENHSFDSYFGNYCEAEPMSNQTCKEGSKCCEKPPDYVQGFSPVVLNDTQNMQFDPNHDQDCERCEINGGRMDGYLRGCYCSNPQNFAVADKNSVNVIHDLARQYALADNYFQPTAGASSQNDMFFARASYVFRDNVKIPIGSIGSNCWYLTHGIPSEIEMFYDPSITSLLAKCGKIIKSYAEGYRNASQSFDKNLCYPYGYDSGDIPFGYYAGISDNKIYMADYEDFKSDLVNVSLPSVSFIKPLGKNTGHPSDGKISDEMNFIQQTVDSILNSDYKDDTLIVWVPDESGGFYDHVKPPLTNRIDDIPYGPRIPMLVMGKFAKKNYISHVEMEHSSIVKFIEWNWLGARTGQLETRDSNVNSIGDLIDPQEAGILIPN